jgi:hypothetical protein
VKALSSASSTIEEGGGIIAINIASFTICRKVTKVWYRKKQYQVMVVININLWW